MENLERELLAAVRMYDENKRIDVLVRFLAQARLETAFERVYRVIFGSQIKGLRRLNGVNHVPVGDARAFFEPFKNKYPEVYESYGFTGWLGFLESESLIRHDGISVEITDIGRDFLLWLTARGLPEEKPF